MDAADSGGLASLAVVLAAVAAVSWIVYRRLGPTTARHESMAFLHHLEELRLRLLRIAILLVMWATLFLSVRAEPLDIGPAHLARPVPSLFDNLAAQIYRGVAASIVPPGVQLIVTSPTEAVGVQMQIALLLAVVVTLPFLLFELWAFFAPGLRAREKRFVRLALPAALVLFATGAAFGYAFVVPLLFRVLYGFAEPLGAATLLSAGSLVGTVMAMCLLFGLAFELPLVMVGLVRLEIVTPQAYQRRWRHAVVAIVVIAGVTTDPTLTSQLIVASLLLVLYGAGLVASQAVHRRATRSRVAATGKPS